MPVAVRTSAGIGMTAASAGGHTMGALAGALVIADIGMIASSSTRRCPIIFPETQSWAPNAVPHDGVMTRAVCARASGTRQQSAVMHASVMLAGYGATRASRSSIMGDLLE